MLTLTSTQEVAQELYQPGRVASLKYALWAASLSPQKRLGWNIAQARTLLPYLDKPLPQDVEKVWAILRAGHPFVSRNNARAILKIEQAERDGRRAELARMPTSYHDWLAWRLAIVGMHAGLSYKAASFVALLMWPDQCPLIPVDSHVCARLGVKSLYVASSRNYKVYRWIERQVLREWYRSGHRQEVSPAVWHWFKWSEWRQATGDEPVNDRPESHNGLSPYLLAA
jgi:hypothetical protein